MTLHPEKCTACRICEMACSFHHTRLFQPAFSSIEIIKHDASGKVEMFIHEQSEGEHRGCDRCPGEGLPLCLKWCPTGAIGK